MFGDSDYRPVEQGGPAVHGLLQLKLDVTGVVSGVFVYQLTGQFLQLVNDPLSLINLRLQLLLAMCGETLINNHFSVFKAWSNNINASFYHVILIFWTIY